MARKKQHRKSRDGQRRIKKKVSLLTEKKMDYVDWKDADFLRRFLSDRSKIRARRVTGNSAQQQKMCADAIKIAREMALLPYTTRVTTQRSSRDRFDRSDRTDRTDRTDDRRDRGPSRGQAPADGYGGPAGVESLVAEEGLSGGSLPAPESAAERSPVEAQA